MPTKSITLKTFKQILRLKYAKKLSHRKIGLALSVSSSSVSRYVNKAAEHGLVQWPIPKTWSADELEHEFLKTTVAAKQVETPNWVDVEKQLKAKTSYLKLLWQAYADQYPANHYSYNHYCRLFRQWKDSIETLKKQADFKSGEKLYTNYCGTILSIANPETGELHPAHLFIAVLEGSGFVYAEVSRLANLEDWVMFHARCFEYLGGTPEIVIPDIVKIGKAPVYQKDKALNLTYQHMLSQYQVKQQTAKRCSYDDKSRVKKAISKAERFFISKLKHEVFSSLAQLNLHTKSLLTKFNQKRARGSKLSRQEVFLNLDKSMLKALPEKQYQYTVVKRCKMHFDYHIEFERHYYSAPYQLLYQHLEMYATGDSIDLYQDGQIVANHSRKYRYGYSTDGNHMPKAEDKNAKWTPERFLKWAASHGEYTVKYAQQIIDSKEHPAQAYRFLMGMMSLHKDYCREVLRSAYEIALNSGVYKLKNLTLIIKEVNKYQKNLKS